jgi:hypothetical protein
MAATEDTNTCPICFDTYSAKARKKVTCQYCPSHACRPCQERYLLQSYEDPNCVDCKRGWSSEFMVATFPLTFRNDKLRKHRRKILFEREKSLLPAMQIFVEAKRTMGRLEGDLKATYQKDVERSEERNRLHNIYYAKRNELTRLREQQRALLAGPLGPDNQASLNTVRAKKKIVKTELTQIEKSCADATAAWQAVHIEYMRIRNQYEAQKAIYEERAPQGEGGGQQRRQFIMKCPAGDCRGFLSTAYKCGTCDAFTCPECLVSLGTDKDAQHTCKPEEIESAKAIKAETRPCPKCGTRIYKIDGCDQMWCVMDGCGTAFSWNTGQIVTGRVHNPHYYEWLRRTGGGAAPREAGDIPCGGMLTFYQIHAAFREAGLYHYDRTLNTLEFGNSAVYRTQETHRNIEELIAEYLPKHPSIKPRSLNKELNIDYLMKELDEAEWQRQLEIVEARFNRKRDIGFILQTVATAASDAYREMVARCQLSDPAFAADSYQWLNESFLPLLEQLREYANTSLKALGATQKMAVPQIGPLFKWTPARILYKAAKKSAATTAAAVAAEEEPLQELPEE